jgi:hypothetical protein
MVVPEVLRQHVLVVDLLVTYWTVHSSALVVHLSSVELDCVLVLEALTTDRTAYRLTDGRVRFGCVLPHSFITHAGLTADRTLAALLGVQAVRGLCSHCDLVKVHLFFSKRTEAVARVTQHVAEFLHELCMIAVLISIVVLKWCVVKASQVGM